MNCQTRLQVLELGIVIEVVEIVIGVPKVFIGNILDVRVGHVVTIRTYIGLQLRGVVRAGFRPFGTMADFRRYIIRLAGRRDIPIRGSPGADPPPPPR
jgi:hypothetical protein